MTGASRGIGIAIATELSDKGAIVIGTATSVDGASNISKTLSAQDRKGEGMILDVNNNDSITNLNNAINDKYGEIQILVNNAGITQDNLHPLLYWIMFVTISLFFYQVLLVLIGWIFGQFQFFWNFEKKMIRRFGLGRFLND